MYQNFPDLRFLSQYNNIIHPNLQSKLTEIATSIVQVLSDTRNQSQLRNYLYNKLSNNNWMNNEFIEAIYYSDPFILTEIGNNRPDYIPNFQNVLFNIIDKVITFLISMDILNNVNGIQKYCDNNAINSAGNNVSIGFDILSRSGYQLPTVANYQQQNLQQQIIMRPTSLPTQHQFFNQPTSIPISTTSGFTSNQPTAIQFFNKDNRGGFEDTQVYKPSISNKPLEQPSTTITNVKLTYKNWKPSTNQFYRSLVDLDFYDELYIKTINDTVIQEVNLKTSIDLMERNRHKIFNTSLMSSIPIAAVTDNIDKSSININKYYENKTTLNTNLERAIISGTAYRENIVDNIYITKNIIANPVIIGESYRDQVLFLNANNLKSNVEHIRKFAEYFPNVKNPRLFLSFVSYLNNYITEIVNDFVEYNLGITTTSDFRFIDSYGEDYYDLLKVLENYNGLDNLYLTALYNYDQGLVNKLFNCLNPDKERIIQNNLKEIKGNGIYSYVPYISIIGYTDLMSTELHKRISNKIAYKIDPSNDKLLYDICSLIVNHRYQQEENDIYFEKHHILYTSDNCRLDLYKSYIEDNTILIKKY